MTQHNLKTYIAQSGNNWKAFLDGTVVGPAPAPSAKPMLIGASFEDWDNFSTTLTTASGSYKNAGLQIRRSYDTGGGSAPVPANFAASAASGDPARGCASFWSCGGETVSTIANGDAARKAAIQQFAASIPPSHLTYITFWHEADQKNKGGTWTYAQMQQAQANVYDWIKAAAVNPSNVLVGPLLTDAGYGYGGADAGAANYFPTDPSKYDFCGVDTYEFWRPSTDINTPLTSPTTTYWTCAPDPHTNNWCQQRTPGYLCNSALNFAKAHGKKLVVGEYSAHPFPTNPSYYKAGTGTIDTISRPYRVQTMVDWHDSNGTLAFCFYHSAGGQRGPWWCDAFQQFSGSTNPVTGHPLSDITPTDHSTYPDPDTVNQIKSILNAHNP